MNKKPKFKPVDPKQNFVEMEKKLLEYWYAKGIVEKYLKLNKNSDKKFSFLDGPITANNPMGVHHAWGRTYKDLWQRFYNMQGHAQRFQNGFDEQGLWVEVEVEKELGFKNKKDIEKFGIDKFVNLCKARVKKFSQIQTEQSKRLGYFMDWENSYHTSSEQNNYAIWNFLKVCHTKGYLYKGRDSVPWCPRCGTAISQHEILTEEYKEITHKAVYVKFQVLNRNFSLLVWTTTPWTLPSNVAIAVHPDLIYRTLINKETGESILMIRGDQVQLSKDEEKAFQQVNLVENVLTGVGKEWRAGESYKGKDLIGLHYKGPFDDFERVKKAKEENIKTFHTIIPAPDLVSSNEGTGLVHIAPGAGEEDFKLAKEEKLPVVESIDESAVYIEGFGDLTGQNAKNSPELIIKKLEEKGVLFKVENYKHRYPTCWRCKTELVWRVVDEWYIAMDRPPQDAADGKAKKTLRHQMMDVTKKINWIPKFGLERELDWLKNMHDWLISKKRYWGLALPIWECKNCGGFEVIGGREELKEKAVVGWDKFEGNSPHRPWIDNIKIKCSNCGQLSARIPDVGNPWLDAGIVSFSTMPPEWFPADFITESFPGQFKNWFYSLIAMSTVLKGENPFKTVLGFATLLDENGQEMHKSKGNAIEFNEAADKIGVDVMRWMYCAQNPTNNLLFGYNKADEVRRRFYLILWNVYSFFVTYANLDGWTPGKNQDSQNILDKWVVSRFNSTINQVTVSLTKYDSQQAATGIENFVIGDLSTWYIRRSRERAGLTAQNQKDKELFYQTLYEILVGLSKLIAPFTPFIGEEIYMNLTGEESVHLADFPKAEDSKIDKAQEEQMSLAREIVEKAHAQRKEKGIKVRQPLKKLEYPGKPLPKAIEIVVADEVNVKEVTNAKTLKLDTRITQELEAEGQAREIIRQIQVARKEAGCSLNQQIKVKLPSWPKDFEDEIKKQTLTSALIQSESLEIVKD